MSLQERGLRSTLLCYWVIGLLGYCVLALYITYEKLDVCLSCLLLLLDIIRVRMFFRGEQW
ncbi:MAG: hypothetical protein AB1765_00095 [Candidatus Hydrogenedentota bacterium]